MIEQTGREYCRSKGIDTNKDISAEQFAKHGVPMIGSCLGCGMTMCIINAIIINGEDIYCKQCI